MKALTLTVELRAESPGRFSVTLLTPDRVGVSAVCKYLGASYADARAEAVRVAELYRAKLRDLTTKKTT